MSLTLGFAQGVAAVTDLASIRLSSSTNSRSSRTGDSIRRAVMSSVFNFVMIANEAWSREAQEIAAHEKDEEKRSGV